MRYGIKTALIIVMLTYCVLTIIIGAVLSCIDNAVLGTAFGVMACIAAVFGIIIVRFLKDDKPEPEDTAINKVEIPKYFDSTEK